MLFTYIAKDQSGRPIEGSIEAFDRNEAGDALFKRNLIIISLKEARPSFIKHKGEPIFILKSVGAKDLVFASRQLAMMISAGLALVDSLELCSSQSTNKYLRYVLLKIAEEVKTGSRFSAALARYPKIFNNFFINMVKAGEVSGRLKEVMEYLANEREKDYNLTKRLQGAMIYPIFIFVTVVGVVIVLMTVVLPNLSSILLESGTQLPWTTRLVMAISDFFANHYVFVIAVIILLIVAAFIVNRIKSARIVRDRILFRIPIIGELLQMIFLTRFTQGLATLLTGGLPIVLALEIVADIVGSDLYRELILSTAREVEMGNSVATAFKKSKDVPATLSHLMTVGEKTGKLEEIFTRVSEFYTREVDRTLTNLVSLLEPFIIIFLGLVVGFIAIAVIVPIYNLTSSFQ